MKKKKKTLRFLLLSFSIVLVMFSFVSCGTSDTLNDESETDSIIKNTKEDKVSDDFGIESLITDSSSMEKETIPSIYPSVSDVTDETENTEKPSINITDVDGFTLISTKDGLNSIRNDLSGKYKLVCDIVFTEADFAEGGAFYNNGAGWMPIGADKNNAFKGIFNGNGHTIQGVQINITSSKDEYIYAGLFGYIEDGTVENLGIVDCSIGTKIEKSTSTAEKAYVGGIVGYLSNATVKDCYNTGNIDVTLSLYNGTISFTYVGGLVGYKQAGKISHCYNIGSVCSTASAKSISAAYSGGIVGYISGGMEIDCYNTGNINAKAESSFAGGIGGHAEYTQINQSYNEGSIKTISIVDMYVHATANSGGIVGETSKNAIINKCYNVGSVLAEATGKGTSSEAITYVGGIAGYMYTGGEIHNCYNIGNVSGNSTATSEHAESHTYVGGIGGYCSEKINNCYNIGSINAIATSSHAQKNIGGILGLFNYGATFSNCYYLNNVDTGIGGSHRKDVSVSCTSDQIKQQLTFVGFDFEKTWVMNNDRPQLQGMIERQN